MDFCGENRGAVTGSTVKRPVNVNLYNNKEREKTTFPTSTPFTSTRTPFEYQNSTVEIAVSVIAILIIRPNHPLLFFFFLFFLIAFFSGLKCDIVWMLCAVSDSHLVT